MYILALDASTEQCSCALLYEQEILARSELAPRRHAELILPMADSLLAEAELTPRQLDAIAFGQGPGSFTGLRIACGVAQGIALAVDVPVIPVSSLATLAQATVQELACQHVLTVLDARMEEVYWGCFAVNAEGLVVSEQEEKLTKPADVNLQDCTKNIWQAVVTAWATYPTLAEQIQTIQGNAPLLRYPQAHAMLPLARAKLQQGDVVTAAETTPVYLRNQVVQA